MTTAWGATWFRRVNSGFWWISAEGSFDANSTWEANNHMQAGPRQPSSQVELAALYRRRETILSLIRSLERYGRIRARAIRGCAPRTSPAAA
jgi:hypothetical protein